jgi:hypothetical protein
MAMSQRQSERVYFRHLPGGGYVSIEVTEDRTLFGKRRLRGELVVERRVDRERREGHVAPSIAQADAFTLASILHKLFPIAQSNTAIAEGCIAHRRSTHQRGALAGE